MLKKGAECAFLHNFHRKESTLETALDAWSGAGDVYVTFHIRKYPRTPRFQEWRRVGDSLYEAIEAYDGPRVERREEGRRERRDSVSRLVAAG